MFRDVPECSGMFRNVPCSMFHVPYFIDSPFPTWLAPILPKNRSLRFNQSEVPWISLGDRFVKLCSTKRDLRLNSKLQNNSFCGPCPAFLGFNGPSMIRSFPLLQESSELRFRLFLHNFGTKCLSKVNPRHWIYISFPVIYSRFKRALVFVWPPDIVNFRIKSLFAITLVQSRRNVHTFDCFGRYGTDTFHHSTSKCHVASCRSRHSSFLARNANENPSSETSRPLATSSLATSSLARPLRDLNRGRFAA